MLGLVDTFLALWTISEGGLLSIPQSCARAFWSWPVSVQPTKWQQRSWGPGPTPKAHLQVNIY